MAEGHPAWHRRPAASAHQLFREPRLLRRARGAAAVGAQLHARGRSARREPGGAALRRLLAPGLRRLAWCDRPRAPRGGPADDDRRGDGGRVPGAGFVTGARSVSSPPHDCRLQRRLPQLLCRNESPELAHELAHHHRACRRRCHRRAGGGSARWSRSRHSAVRPDVNQHRRHPCASQGRHDPVREPSRCDGRAASRDRLLDGGPPASGAYRSTSRGVCDVSGARGVAGAARARRRARGHTAGHGQRTRGARRGAVAVLRARAVSASWGRECRRAPPARSTCGPWP